MSTFKSSMFFGTVAFLALFFCGISFATEDSGAKPRGRYPEKMIVKVVDETGKPITNAYGNYHFGKYENFNVDENGEFTIPMPSEEEQKNINYISASIQIEMDGYGPFIALFESAPVIPDTFTIVLKPAQKIGGVIVDEEGNPVNGVNVELVMDYETSYNTFRGLVTTVKTVTEADGKWSFFRLPATFNDSPSINLTKDGFLTTRVSDILASHLKPDANGSFNEKLTIERGYTFSGKIVDKKGNPIEGAEVRFDTMWHSTEPVVSNADGIFRFENQPLNAMQQIVVTASDMAPQMKLVEIRSKNEPVEIVMTPGRKVIFEVSDSSGKPIPDTTFRVKEIDGYRCGHYLAYTNSLKENNEELDQQGQFIWNDAPDLPFEMSCNKQDYSDVAVKVEPEQETVPITLYRSKIKLNVVDADTGEPIPRFSFVSRMFEQPDSERPGSWTFPEQGTSGMETNMYGSEYRAWQFEISSPGYEKQQSRKVVYGEENVELEIRLAKSSDSPEAATKINKPDPTTPKKPLFPLSGAKVLTPNGEKAENATVEITIQENVCGPDAKPVFTNVDGVFILSDDQQGMIGPQKFVLKIAHQSGVAVVDGETFRKKHDSQKDVNASPIQLIKWGRIEGTIQSGKKTLEGTNIAIRLDKSNGLPVLPSYYQGTTTKRNGNFVFTQVMPGTITISKDVPTSINSAWSSYCGSVEVKPGETTVCTIGNSGQAVTGKAVAPGKIDYRKYTARIVVKPENLDDLQYPELPKEYWPDPSQDAPNSCNVKRLAWYNTPEGKKYKDKLELYGKAVTKLRFTVLNPDGTFLFDDIPAGEYALLISETDNCGMGFDVGDWYVMSTFTVVNFDEPQNAPPLDLGNLNLLPTDKKLK
ncbi:MAG: carboxypeptidase-like regulatory domain-containing protein [Thermoguttaceae bacterium]